MGIQALIARQQERLACEQQRIAQRRVAATYVTAEFSPAGRGTSAGPRTAGTRGPGDADLLMILDHRTAIVPTGQEDSETWALVLTARGALTVLRSSNERGLTPQERRRYGC
ncbi:hypothetical protein [Streptomyces sp. NPDC002779]|uniref:hypothetical protein n=1 Tax=Streptomyces sp. NPDC002779 TaxID=3364664 RepID=UPI00368A27D0